MKKNWRVSWDEAAPASANARAKLPQLATGYIAAGSAVAIPGCTPEQLHQLRLATKHFRYTLEAFRPVYGEPLEAWLKELRQVQQFLGDINDCRVAHQRFAADPEAPEFLDFLDQRLAAIRDEFLAFWRRRFSPPARLARWRAFLAGESKAAPSGRARQRLHRKPVTR